MNTPRTYALTDDQGLVIDNNEHLTRADAEETQCILLSQGIDCNLQREDK